ncbi:sigma-70 family RNA polymerase sigma factor [Arthrobacter flavus]|uniref:RNA polymerase sigma factor n=1 Tax=Arthrobacter flavus TaxID=95172 RepID=A0ABW4Q9I0_9MICC
MFGGKHDQRFAAVDHQLRPRVFNYIYRRVSSRDEADELTNDVFRIAWERYPDAGDMTVAWLLAVARNVVGNEYRRRERAGLLMERLHESVRVAARIDNPDGRQEAVAAGLLRLREADREVLLLAYWDDLAASDIAQVLDCSPAAVRVRLHRARKAFAKTIPAKLLAEGDA